MTQHKTVCKRILTIHPPPDSASWSHVWPLFLHDSPPQGRQGTHGTHGTRHNDIKTNMVNHVNTSSFKRQNSWRSPTSCSPNGPHVFFKHCLAAAQQHAKAHDTQNSHGFFRLQNCRDDRVGFQSQVNLIGLSPMFAKLGLPKQCPNVPN